MEKKKDKARVVIDIEDLREITAQTEDAATGEQSDEASVKVRGARAAAEPIKSTIMCPW
ncbi:MAG TPA: hypothetical protein VFQ35_22300 [Polyangiaceae bacterium]|nr:hypothetical protein [Polyangiaceae bacterium]